MLPLLPYLIIIFAAFAGAMLASYIRYKKTNHQVLVCPLHSSCETVTHSEFSRFFGVPVELLGIAYYILTACVYAIYILVPNTATVQTIFLSLVITTVAFMFSMYLTFIQAFTLKQWCTWCLISAGLCTTIFIAAIAGSDVNITGILAANYRLVLALHLLGLAFGLGAATIADLLFFKFLKDLRISHEEAGVLSTLSQIIWFGIAVLVLSGIGLYLPQMEVLNHSSKFLTKVVVVTVIIINGAFLNLKISPQLVHISFGAAHRHMPGELRRWRRIAFALGGVSVTSWYSAFLLGLTPYIPLSFSTLLLIYLALLAGAVTGGQVLGLLMGRRRSAP